MFELINTLSKIKFFHVLYLTAALATANSLVLQQIHEKELK